MLIRKMWRDMKAQKAQFLSVLSMIFIGLFVFAGMSAEGEGMRKSSADYYRQTNLADAMIYSPHVSTQEITEIQNLPGIDAAERRAQLEGNLKGNKDAALTLLAIEQGNISKLHLMEGEDYDEKQTGVWLDTMFADAHRIKTGDTITITTAAGALRLPVRGLIMQPEYIYAIRDESQVLPDHSTYGYAFLSGKQYPQIDDSVYSQILIQGNVKKEKLEQFAQTRLVSPNAAVLMQKDFPGQAMFANEIEQQKAVQFVFPIAFLLIAILTMITAMTRMTSRQRTQIGTMKAVGMSSAKIYGHYLSYGMIPALAGGIAGTAAGIYLLPKLMFGFQSQFYAIPSWKSEVPMVVYLALVLCTAICAAAAYLACRRELKQAAADILRPRQPAPVKATTMERTGWWKKRSFRVQWNIRDIFRNKMRSTITVIGVAGCMMLILCALGLNRTIDGMLSWMYEELQIYETKVTLKETGAMPADMDAIQFIQEGQAQVKINGKSTVQSLTVAESGPFLRYTDAWQNETKLPDADVAVTYKTAGILGIETGDTIKWRPYGSAEWVSSRVGRIIRTPLSQGLYLTKNAFQMAGYTMTPTAFVTDRDTDQFDPEQYQSVRAKKEIVKDMDTMLETMNAMIGILIAAAVVLGIVVLYNLGALSFAEKERDLATLQVLGFDDEQLKKLLAMQNLWLTGSGILAGIPLGYLMLSYLLGFMGDTMDMVPVIGNVTCMLSTLGILLLSGVVNVRMSRKLKQIQMVEALKGAE